MIGILNLIWAAGMGLLCARLLVSGLYRRYRAFLSYAAFTALREGIVSQIDPGGGLYQKIWVVTEPMDWLFCLGVVLELYALVLKDYRGLSTVGRWILSAAVLLAVLASSASLLAPSQYTFQGHLMQLYYVAERAVYLSLVVFLLTMLGFILQYPVTLSRNVVVHSVVVSVYFLSATLSFLLLSIRGATPAGIERIQYTLLAVDLAATGTWLSMLTPAGELRKQRLRPTWMPGREEVLVSQLNHLNAALLRATRK